MAEKNAGDFDSWLTELLNSWNIDGEVYAGYISGTLETLAGSPPEEIEESLSDILGACVENEADSTSLGRQIAQQWLEQTAAQTIEEKSVDVQAEVDRLMQTPSQPTPDSHGNKPSSTIGVSGAEGFSAKEKLQLVAQYDYELDEEDLDEEEDPGGGGGGDFFQNRNKAAVVQAQRQRKEQQKVAHEAKLERDRKSRELQKQRQQERKEKEKKRTQKQERRR